ncbi:MAG: hypothetical protein ABGW78_04340 [Pirellulales bacterium]
MTFLALFSTVTLSCLLWSAVFTGIAARVSSRWLRCVLAVLAIVVPLCALLPWLVTTFALAFLAELDVNWFGPILTVFTASLVGGLCILRGGLTPPDTDTTPLRAARWPVIGLFLAFLLSKLAAGGILFALDSKASGRIDDMKRESADLMASVLIPEVSDLSNAATFYRAAFQIMNADKEITNILDTAETIDPTTSSVENALARHNKTLSIIRRGAKKEVYRIDRDWSRPSFSMLLPELQSIRSMSKLVCLSVRNRASKGDVSGALEDVWVLYRIRQHAASEPCLISGLVGASIDSFALNAFTEVLTHTTENDLQLLEGANIYTLIAVTPSFKRHILSEEAFGIKTYADFCTGLFGVTILGNDEGFMNLLSNLPQRYQIQFPLFYRVFLFTQDYELYRSTMSSYHNLLALSEPYDNVMRQTKAIDEKLTRTNAGILARLLTPALSGVFKARVRSESLHQAAMVALAATIHRIKTGDVPSDIEDLIPDSLSMRPMDPHMNDAAMTMKILDDALVIYSVGPNGKDDGGPPERGSKEKGKNDDVGLRLMFKKN